MDELVSVIIPVYNRQKYIEECVQSIFDSSYSNFEIIIIDDGSTDCTLEICRELEKQQSSVRLLETEHAGVSAARNAGIDAAQGEYILFVDSDDVIHPRLMGTLVDALKNGEAAIAGTCNLSVPEKYWHKVAEVIAQETDAGEIIYRDYEETLPGKFAGNSPFSQMGGMMMRKDFIGDTRFCTDLFIGEDFYFAYENLNKQVGTAFLKQKWYYGRLHEHNSSWSFGYAGYKNRFYRRELVWKNEEALGRLEFANQQKREAFGFCIGILPICLCSYCEFVYIKSENKRMQ